MKLNEEELNTLPVGSVVLDSGSGAYLERCAWTKTSDSARVDDEHPFVWMSAQWTMDRLDHELVEQFGPICLVWDAGES